MTTLPATGYLHSIYAQSFAEVGVPIELPSCGGWLIGRAIPGFEARDAMGCYPLFCCADWRRLASDLDALAEQLVSVVLVADPFGEYDAELLEATFDQVRPFKEQFVVDLSRAAEIPLSAHHRRNSRRALASLRVEETAPTDEALADWIRLYQMLRARHGITGLADFSRRAFGLQFEVPGLTLLRATLNEATVGMTLWYRQRDRVYYHLGAYSDEGYARGAAFALFRTAIDRFAGEGFRWLALGAGAGVRDGDDGLTRFKRGWATGTRTAFLCGRICSASRYAELSTRNTARVDGYFPAYRSADSHVGPKRP